MAAVSYSTPLVPRQLRLELTSYCNAHCAPCHRSLMLRKPQHMDWNLVEKVVSEASQLPERLQEVVLSDFGETMLYPAWERAAQLVARKLPSTHLVLPTNGTLLTDEVVEKLARLPTLKLVNLSVNAYLPETYVAFHKLPASNLKAIEAAALRIRKLRPDIILWLSMVRAAEYQSEKEVELFREHWGKIGQVQINLANYAGVPGREPLTPVSLPCRSLFSDLVVLADGQCLSCCFVAEPLPELVVGDANAESLMALWHSKRFNEIRQLHSEGRRAELNICRTCTFS